MPEAAGFMLYARATGRVLFLLRAADGTWDLPGGMAERSDQDLIDTALRELAEETGYVGDIDYAPHGALTKLGTGAFLTMEANVQCEFEPDLGDGEHVSYAWEHPDNVLYPRSAVKPLHPGVKSAVTQLLYR